MDALAEVEIDTKSAAQPVRLELRAGAPVMLKNQVGAGFVEYTLRDARGRRDISLR